MSIHKKPRIKFHIEWNKVTWYSKLAAVILFITVLFFGIWIGTQYQYAVDQFSVADKLILPVAGR